MLRAAPYIAIALLCGPVLAGLAGALLPAFGYLPALGGHSLTWDPVLRLFQMPGLWTSVWLSLVTGFVTTAISFCVVMALIAAWSETRAFTAMRAMVSPLLSIPHAAAAFGFAFLIAPSGWLFRLVSPWATGFERPPDLLILNDPYGLSLMAGLVMKEMPFLFLVALAALPQTDATNRMRVARSLGYGRMAAWFKVVLPALYPQIRLAIFAVMAFGTSVVDVALILGPTRPPTLAVRVVQWLGDPDLTMRFVASAGALLQVLVTLAAILLWIAMEKLVAWRGYAAILLGARRPIDGLVRQAVAVLALASAVFVFAGLAVLALWSLTHRWRWPDAWPAQMSLRNWERSLEPLSGSLSVTIALALLTTLIALVITLACLENEHRSQSKVSPRALSIVYLPLLVPQVSFLFGLNVVFLALGLDGTFFAVAFAHLVFVMPYVFLSLADPWRALDPRYSVVATSLRASPWRAFFAVRLPLILTAVLTAAGVGIAVSVGQYLPTILIGAGRFETVTTEAINLSAGGNRRLIGVYASVQTALAFVGFALAALLPILLFRNRRGMGARR